jgi:hypothetical protein
VGVFYKKNMFAIVVLPLSCQKNKHQVAYFGIQDAWYLNAE